MKQISILGCGWLGLPLAKALLEKGFSVKGSTTSAEKRTVLEKNGILPYQILLESDSISPEISSFLDGSDILIIDIPPKLRGKNALETELEFVKKIENLIPFIEKSTIQKVLFVSSTSVYGDRSSLDFARDDALSVTEETKTCPETESGKQLVMVEKLLQNNPNFKTCVLRFGGLIGEDRHPIPFLAGKRNLENPKASINLIHQVDCIGIIQKIIERGLRTPEVSGQNVNEVWNETFNAVAPFHPTRQDYYTQKAMDFGLELPQFNLESPTFGKTILTSKVETVLGYTFLKPNL